MKYILIIISIIFFSCDNKILIEYHDTDNFLGFDGFDVFERYGEKLDSINIIGWISINDRYEYRNTEIKNNNQDMKILMYAELSKFNKSGSRYFNIEIPVKKNIEKVYFGRNKILIWERKSIEVLNNREKLLELKKYTHREDIIKIFGIPDNIINGYPVYSYNLMNNRRAILNFIDGNDRLLILSEEINGIENIIFDN